jgi:hypothetical protein
MIKDKYIRDLAAEIHFCFMIKIGFLYFVYFFLDIGECSSNPCHVNADCTNTFGAFTCACKPGYTGNGLTTCDGECIV